MKSLLTALMICFAIKSYAADVGLVYIVGGTNEATALPGSLIGAYIVDSQGRRTGVDPTRPPVIDPTYLDHTCCYVGQIPEIHVSHNRLDPDDNSGAFGDESFEISGQLPAGTYNLIVFSTVTYPVHYLTELRLSDSAGKMNTIITKSSLPAGTTASFTINYDPTPGKVPVVVKSVSFPILRGELSAAFQLGDIGGKRFVDELEDLLAQGEKALGRKDRDDRDHRHDGDDHGKQEAIEMLRQFISQVDRAAKEKPDQGHDRDHDHDRDDKRFATSTAAQSLTSDAKTLIQQLGGASQKDLDEKDHR